MRVLIIVALLIASSFNLFSQDYSVVADKALSQNEIVSLLPPLGSLIDSAQKHSPLLKIQEADILIKELSIRAEKRDWMKNFGFDAGVRYGMMDNIVVSREVDTDIDRLNKEVRYNAGFFFRVPFSMLFDNTNTKLREQEQVRAKYEYERVFSDLKRLIITQYNNILMSHKTMLIRAEHVATYNIQLVRAEKDFLEGNININEYSRFNEMYSQARVELETNKIEFLTNYQVLQEIIGVKIDLNW